MPLRPLHDRIVVRRKEPLKKSPGGIIIPENVQEKPAEGVALAVGPGLLRPDGSRRPMTVRVGETVLFGKFSGVNAQIDGEDVTILMELEVLAHGDPDDNALQPDATA